LSDGHYLTRLPNHTPGTAPQPDLNN